MARNRRLQEKIRDRNTTPESVARIQAITPGESILLIHNPRNPAYRRICDAVMEHGKLDYRLKSSTEIQREDFNGTKAVYLTHWGMIDAIPGEYQGKIIVGVWEGDSWLRENHLTDGSQKAFSRAHAIFAANQGFADRLRLLTGKPVSVTTDGVDTMLFKPMVHLRPNGERLRVGIVGCNWRGDDHKGISIAREACNEVGAELWVLDSKTGTHPYIPHEEMPLWYNRLDALLICSKEEGGPNPGLEAMACGLPVISTRVGVMGELLADEWLCDRTAAAFSEKLRELSSIGDRRKLGRRNRDRIVSGGWSWKDIACIFEGFLQAELDRVIETEPIHIPQKKIVKDTPPQEDHIAWKETPVPKICWFINDMGVGGAQTAVLRWANSTPLWIKERSVVFIRMWHNDRWPMAEKYGELPGCPEFVRSFPEDTTHLICEHGRPDDDWIKGRRSYVIIISQNVEYNTRLYGGLSVDRALAPSDAVRHVANNLLSNIGKESPGFIAPYFLPASRMSTRNPIIDGSITVLYAGRLTRDKGADCLPYMLHAEPRLKLVIRGGVDIWYDERVQRNQKNALHDIIECAKSLGVDDRIVIEPLHIGVDMSPVYVDSNADCLVVPSLAEGFCLSIGDALQHGLPVACTYSSNAAGLIREEVSGALFDYDLDPETRGRNAAPAVVRAASLSTYGPMNAISPWVGDHWRKKHGRDFLESIGCCLTPSDTPIVTVAVRYHANAGMIDWLDECMTCVASQTYRQFTTLLVIDGLEEDASEIAARYEVPFICTGMDPHHHHRSLCHRLGANYAKSKYYKPLDFDDIIAPDYLERAVFRAERDSLDIYSCRMMTKIDGEISKRPWPAEPWWNIATDNVFPHSAVLLNRQALIDAGNYNESAPARGTDDWDTWRRMFLNGSRVFRDDDYYGMLYRRHDAVVTKLLIADEKNGAGDER